MDDERDGPPADRRRGKNEHKQSARAARKGRLADELRANLRKRKSQMRSRNDPESAAQSGVETGC